ncbi:hypothetical protein LUZ63_012253 [Rhynchospora breviuscula]|uniref:Integrase catalytic domain-containing protein n=1 Tax=Rhynchospora breviuscula TaxID=2022672 RepID=A0A9Q0CKQ7_9POAL|nr:hypothetical protein LUZ63_012253 [Rhynchospora breviuscula]
MDSSTTIHGVSSPSSSSLTSDPSHIVSLTLPVSTKLTSSNYLTWQCQILPIINGYNLTSFIESASPSPTITNADGGIDINPAYLPWHRQDQLLLGWIRSTLSDQIQSQVVSCVTSRELWSSLQQTFAATSRARIIDLKRQIQNTTRGSSSCSDYLAKMRHLADELAFIGAPISSEDLISNIISGLGSDYNPFFASIAAASRHESFSFSDLQGLLLGFESLLKNQSSSSSSSSSSLTEYQPPSAFAIGTAPQSVRTGVSYQYNARPTYQSNFRPRGYQPRGRSPYQYNPVASQSNFSFGNPRSGHRPQNNNSSSFPQQSPQPRPPRPNSSSLPSNTKQFCQICNKFGFHTAKNCWFRYNEDSSWTPPTTAASSSPSPQAYIASASTDTATSSDWILDSGASSHVASDLNNLSAFYNYEGIDSLQIGNGMGLPISHIGTAVLTVSNLKIKLNNVLVVPSFSKNLISISKLLADNPQILIEFSSTSCSFKDLLTRDITHQVTCSSGLFCLTSTSLPQAYSVNKVSAELWHARLVNVFSLFKQQIENQLSTTIQTIRTDGGTEFKPIATKFPQIVHQTSCPYTPQQNGTSERKHRNIIELALAMMSHASIPHMYWDEIFSNAVYLINRLPSSTTSQIPYTSLFNSAPDYSFLRVIGCLCFPHTRHYNSNKLQLRSMPCVLLGYATTQKGYRCLHVDTNRIFTSISVQFDEHTFPFAASSNSSLPLSEEADSNSIMLSGPPLLEMYISRIPQEQPNIPPPIGHVPGPVVSARLSSSQLPLPDHLLNTSTDRPLSPDRSSPTAASITNHSQTPSTPPPPATTSVIPPSTHSMITRTRDHTRKVRQFPDHVAFLTASTVLEPTCFSQANQHPEWRSAMAKEIDALALNQTWTLVPPPTDQRVVGCKWVYKLKRHSDGTIERHKARLVAKGYHQQEGIDYGDTFSPVVRPTTVRLVLSLAISSDWKVHQLDVQNAFLHGDLHERVFMSQPPGFVDQSHPHHVCLLQKSIYGLKQSPRSWFHKLSTALIEFGFTASQYDPSLFFAHNKGHTTIVLVYVDDILITGSNPQFVKSCMTQLQSKFAIKDLGLLHYFLGIAVTTNHNGVHLSQSKYIHQVLQNTNMLNAKPTTTPMATDISLSPGDSDPFSDPHLYRCTVGALQYATVTRPDLSFAVNKLSQFMHNPTINQWSAVKRVLRYLCGTVNFGLQIYNQSDHQLHAYTDSDWAGSHFDRRSTSGYSIFLGRNIISWSAKKQATVSRSSTEAEYRGLAITCTELLWVQFLLQELKFKPNTPPVMWCDNVGATFLASNPMFHSRTKHVEIDFHFVREKVAAKTLLVRYLCSADQIADIMTKPLSTARFEALRHKLNVLQSPLACGGGGVSKSNGVLQ